ncbi:hypothetical protein HAX54_023193 [Datura stramonium]|uniref:Uncharacterized protein n=1 Tax=Datura stramonium TaxID=4076 RepID=A0ABS8UYR2_DATST|nr:hypothetical protein [Datura stramonium]
MASPISSKLGEKVLEECAAIVRPYLSEALKSMSLGPYDAEIVVSICNKMPKGEEMMVNENAPDTVHPVKVGPSEAKFCEPAWHDDTHREKLKDSCTTDIMKSDNPEDVQPATNAEVSSKSNKLTERKSESSIKNEEGNIKKHKKPSLQQIDGMKQQNKEITIMMHNIEESGDKDSTKARAIKDHGEELVGAKIKVVYVDGDIERLKLYKERWEILEDHSSQKVDTHREQLKDTRTTKPENPDDGTKAEVILARRNKPGRDSRKNESASKCVAECKAEFSMKSEEVSLQQIHGMKQRKKKTAIKIYDFEESGDKVDTKTAQ